MPLFELTPLGIKPFRRLASAADVYEAEIETLFWNNLESFVGEPLFPVARQGRIAGGGIPDIIALDPQGRVVVVEIKRDIDRGQLAQCLEYAGWARTTSLDELAGIYAQGAQKFFTDWQNFTGTTTPSLLDRSPRLVLVARSFDDRTESALDFLRDAGVPLKLVQVVFYEDANGARIVDVNNGDAGSNNPVPPTVAKSPLRYVNSAGRLRVNNAVTLMDLLEAGVLEPDEPLVWSRPQMGQVHRAVVSENGEVVVADGRSFTSLSLAAVGVAGGSFNGWECWTVPRLGGERIGSLRSRVTQPT